MSSTPIRVRFENDPTIFYVHRDFLKRLLGRATEPSPVEIAEGEVNVKGTTVWSFHFLLRLLYRDSRSSTSPNISALANAQLVELFLAATKFRHTRIIEDCLSALHY